MADTDLLKRLYADEPDEQLIDKVLNKNSGLTADALIIAKAELAKRNIDLAKLEIINEEKIEQRKKYEKFLAEKTETEIRELKDFIITEKLKNRTNSEVIQALDKRGIHSEFSAFLFLDVKEESTNTVDSIWGDLFYGGTGVFITILITVWVYQSTEGTRIFIAIGLMIAALFKFFTGIAKLTLYTSLKKVLKGLN